MREFNYAAFRAEYVKLAGMTTYERCNYRAEMAAARHYDVMAAKCRASYARDARRAAGVDVEARASREWHHDPDLWREVGRGYANGVDRAAYQMLFDESDPPARQTLTAAERREVFGEVMREGFDFTPIVREVARTLKHYVPVRRLHQAQYRFPTP